MGILVNTIKKTTPKHNTLIEPILESLNIGLKPHKVSY